MGLQQMTTDLDEQMYHCIDLLKPLIAGRKTWLTSGSKYHESLDTRIHYNIAQQINGKYLGALGNIKLIGTKRTINIAHGESAAWVYRTMIMDRDAMTMLQSMQLKKLPHIDMIIRGHWHTFTHIHMPGMHMLQVPGWQAFVPWKGAMKSYGKFQPDIGACILIVDKADRMLVLPFLMEGVPHISDAVWAG